MYCFDIVAGRIYSSIYENQFQYFSSSHNLQNEDMAALAAQQYYVEMGADLVPERLNRMIPSVIPDSFLAGHGMSEKWMEMIMDSFRKVRVWS